jgi:hypothetical protein
VSRQTDIQKLIAIYNRRLQKLRENEAFHGIDTAPEIQLEIETIETRLTQLEIALEEANTSASGDEARSIINIDKELAKFEAEEQSGSQSHSTTINISDVSGGSINLGNIVTGSSKGDVTAGDKVYGDKVLETSHNKKRAST